MENEKRNDENQSFENQIESSDKRLDVSLSEIGKKLVAFDPTSQDIKIPTDQSDLAQQARDRIHKKILQQCTR